MSLLRWSASTWRRAEALRDQMMRGAGTEEPWFQEDMTGGTRGGSGCSALPQAAASRRSEPAGANGRSSGAAWPRGARFPLGLGRGPIGGVELFSIQFRDRVPVIFYRLGFGERPGPSWWEYLRRWSGSTRPPGWTASCGPLGSLSLGPAERDRALGKGQFTRILDISKNRGFPVTYAGAIPFGRRGLITGIPAFN